MKKLSLFSIALLAPFLTFGITTDFAKNSDLMCIQMIQPAINANGECKEFSTPCEVPSDWKKVSSCADFAEKKSSTIGEATKRRHESKWKALRAKVAQNSPKKNKSEHKFLRKSRGFTKSNFAREAKDYGRVRAASKKNWNSKYRKLVSPARQKMIDEKAKLQKIKNEARSANKLRKRVGSATQAVRTGKLSNKFWSTAAKSREKRNSRFSTDSETIKKALQSRQPFRIAKKKREYTPKHAQIRRTFKGTIIRGNLNN